MILVPAALEATFRQDLYTFEESRQMPYATTVERAGIEKGLQQGLKQGMEQGIEQGMQRGEQIGYRKGEAGLLLWLVEKKFGAAAVAGVQTRIDGADSDTLRLWSERILTSDSLEALFR